MTEREQQGDTTRDQDSASPQHDEDYNKLIPQERLGTREGAGAPERVSSASQSSPFPTIQAIWHNPHHDASLNTLDKIARALGVPVTELLEDVPEGPPPTSKQAKKVAEESDTYLADERE